MLLSNLQSRNAKEPGSPEASELRSTSSSGALQHSHGAVPVSITPNSDGLQPKSSYCILDLSSFSCIFVSNSNGLQP